MMGFIWRGHQVGSGMTHISGYGRSQLLFLPEEIDGYAAVDNLAARMLLSYA